MYEGTTFTHFIFYIICCLLVVGTAIKYSLQKAFYVALSFVIIDFWIIPIYRRCVYFPHKMHMYVSCPYEQPLEHKFLICTIFFYIIAWILFLLALRQNISKIWKGIGIILIVTIVLTLIFSCLKSFLYR